MVPLPISAGASACSTAHMGESSLKVRPAVSKEGEKGPKAEKRKGRKGEEHR